MKTVHAPKPAAAALLLMRHTLTALVALMTLSLAITISIRTGLRRIRHYVFYMGRPGFVYFQCPDSRASDSNQATLLVRMGTGRDQYLTEIPVYFDNIHYHKLSHLKNRHLHMIFSRALDEGMSPVGLCMQGMVLSPYTAHKICERKMGEEFGKTGITDAWVNI